MARNVTYACHIDRHEKCPGVVTCKEMQKVSDDPQMNSKTIFHACYMFPNTHKKCRCSCHKKGQ